MFSNTPIREDAAPNGPLMSKVTDDGGNTESHTGPTDFDFDDGLSMSSNDSAEVTESGSPTSSPSNEGSTVLSATSSDSEGALAGCRSNLSSET